jgi:type VII secretion protein EccB
MPWTLCATPDDSGSTVRPGPVLLAVGTAPGSGRALAPTEALLVRDTGDDGVYLVTGGRRYLVKEPDTVRPALFGAVTTVTPVGTAWLNALPRGGDISPIRVDGRGAPSAAVAGHRVGDVLMAETGSGPQYYLVFDDGLAPISHLQETILRAQGGARADQVAIDKATAAPVSRRLTPPTGDAVPPADPPTLAAVAKGDDLCALTRDPNANPEIVVGDAGPAERSANPTGSANPQGVLIADRVYVPAGRVAIVRTSGASGVAGATYHLVTDVGIRYPVETPEALALLGYSTSAAVTVPPALVNKLPVGPTLDPRAALLPAPRAE